MTEEASKNKVNQPALVLEPAVVKLLDRIEQMGYEIFQNAIGLGRWPDGEALIGEDLAQAMQALLIYEHRHVPLEKRSGFIFKGQCKS